MSIREMFLKVIFDRNSFFFYDICIKKCKALPEYTTEKAVDIYFDEIRDIMTWRNWEGHKIEWCINPTPREARELAIMLEEWYRWEIVD